MPRASASSAARHPELPLRACSVLQEFIPTVIDSDDAWAVLVTTGAGCDMCAHAEQALAKVNKAAGGVVRFGVIDVMQQVLVNGGLTSIATVLGLMREQNQVAVPAIVMYAPGPKTISSGVTLGPESVAGVSRTAKSLWAVLKGLVPRKLATTVTDDSVQAWASNVHAAPFRVLFVTKTLGKSVVFNKLAAELQGRATFAEAAFAGSPGLAAALREDSKSVLLVSQPDVLTSTPSMAHIASWQRYEGPPTYMDIKAWLAARLPAAPPVPIIDGPAKWKQHCVEGPGVCVLGLLDVSLHVALPQYQELRNAAGHAWIRADFSSFGTGGVTGSLSPLQWAAVPLEQQPDLRAVMALPPAPALVLLNPRKQLYAVMEGSFNEQNIAKFVRKFLADAKAKANPGQPADPTADDEPLKLSSVARLPSIKPAAGLDVDEVSGMAAHEARRQRRKAAKKAKKTKRAKAGKSKARELDSEL